MDMSERWDCSKHELCEDPNKSGRKVLCNSTVFCTAASDSATTVLVRPKLRLFLLKIFLNYEGR